MKDWIMELCPEIAEWQAETIEKYHESAMNLAREAVVQELVAVGWQPIETAPKDGTAVLVMRDLWPGTDTGRAEKCNGHNTYVAAWWQGERNGAGAWICYMDAVQDPECPVEPTHWMPLPPAPRDAHPAPEAKQEPVALGHFMDGKFIDAIAPDFVATVAPDTPEEFAQYTTPLYAAPVEPVKPVKPAHLTDEAWRQLSQVMPFRMGLVERHGSMMSLAVLHTSIDKIAAEQGMLKEVREAAGYTHPAPEAKQEPVAQGEPRIYGAVELAQMQQRGRDMHTRPAPVNQQSVRVGHLQISRHQTSGIWLRHDSGEAMQTDEDKLYQHLSEYWNKEF